MKNQTFIIAVKIFRLLHMEHSLTRVKAPFTELDPAVILIYYRFNNMVTQRCHVRRLSGQGPL